MLVSLKADFSGAEIDEIASRHPGCVITIHRIGTVSSASDFALVKKSMLRLCSAQPLTVAVVINKMKIKAPRSEVVNALEELVAAGLMEKSKCERIYRGDDVFLYGTKK